VLALGWGGAVWSQTVTLNLKNADINALIATVAEVTGKNFIVDPRVKGKVTVVSAEPLDSQAIYEVFESILKVHGFAAVPAGDVIKIVPDVNAKQDSIPTVENGESRGDQMVTRVVQVENVAAAQLVPILRPLVPQQGHLAAYPATNVLIISDRADNVSRLVQIINRIDQVSDSEIEVIPLQHASASEVVRILTALQRSAGAQAKAAGGSEITTLVADERTNSVLLGGERSERIRMRAIIGHLDTPLKAGGNTHVVYLRYAKAADLVPVLTGVGQSQTAEAGKAPQPAGAKAKLDIQADEATNALVITAPPDVFQELREVISLLDVRRAQVLVEAVIAEVTSDKGREFGIQWLYTGDNARGGVVSGAAGQTITSVGETLLEDRFPSLGPGLTLGVAGYDFSAVLQLLSRDVDTNILSTPTLVTLDNEAAEIIVGQNVPFVTGSFTDTGASEGATNPFQTIQREDVGLTLKINPQINEGDALRMEIEQEISSIAQSGDVEASDIITNKRSVKTVVLVDSGTTIVLGGLIEERLAETIEKVPFFGDLPLLGYFFKSRGTARTKTNLLVFIHPVILRDNALAGHFSQQKYNYIRARQLEQVEGGVELMPDVQPPLVPDWAETLRVPSPEELKVEEAARPDEVAPSE
jgi:general secretion pathway protein D